MAVIVPTLTTDQPETFTQLLTAFASFAPRLQIDFSDGTFAPTQLVPLTAMNLPAGPKFDLHLMTAKPSEYIDQAIALKPHLCILHAEVDEDISALAGKLRAAGIKFGVALLPGTFPGRAQNLISNADHALIFSGTLGRQGGTADLLQMEKVPLLRAIKPDIEIGWDGGANLTNVRALAHGDIDVINVGGAISGAADPALMYQSLTAETEKKGVLL